MATDFINKNRRQVFGGPTTLTNVDSSATNQWFGEAVIGSRDVYIAAPPIAATSRVRTDLRWYGTGSLSVAPNVYVSSTMPNSGFFLSTVASVGLGVANGSSFGVWWEIVNPSV
jgi:hypothetical protein